METVHLSSAEALGSVADQIFGLLRAEDRAPIPTVGDHAYQQIWLELVAGVRKPGEHLSDVEIAATLGVSRTPVREALRRLVQEELVRADPRRGFWVREFTAQDIREFYDVRSALETLALDQGAANIPARDLHDQLDRIDALRARLADQPAVEFLQHDFTFHNLLINASGNGRVMRILATLRAQVSIFQIRDTGFLPRIGDALNWHERIVQALLDANPSFATSLLADHIAASRDAVLADLFQGSNGKGQPHAERLPGGREHDPPSAGATTRGHPAHSPTVPGEAHRA